MYTTFYGFTDLPFNNTPDPDFFFMSPGHQRALLFLLYAIREKKGLITVTGKAGTGKTALLQVIQREIGQAVKMVFFLDTGAGLPVLLGHILEKIGICCQDPSKDSFELLREGLLHQIQQGISVVLVVDEAHGLEWRQLEQIRLLLNLETTDQKLLQVILIGQPELQSKLNQPTVQQLKQRIDLSCRLDPLSESESFQYIEHRLKRAGRDQQDIFSYEALQEVYRRSQGIPRLINNLCDKALLLGFTRQQHDIDHDTIQELFSLFESQDGKPVQPRLVRKDDDQLHLADRECQTDQEYQTGQEYQMVNAGKRIHPLPARGDDAVLRFLHDGLRTVLGQQGRRQPQGREFGACAGGEERSGITGRLPHSPADEANRYQGANHYPQGNSRQSAYPNGSGPKESSPKGSDSKESGPKESDPKAEEPIKRKPLSPEYIKQFESLNIFSSDKSQGHMLKRCLNFLPNLLIRNSRRLMGLNGKKLSFPSKVLEEYQRIKNNLYQANPLNKAQTLVFSSSNSGEGTSTVAINFAVTFALTEDAKILLVDANFRAPKLHRLFGLPRSEGLGEIIREKINWKDSLRSCKIPNLSIITAGDVGLNPVHLLKSAVLERTIQEFTEHFDHVLFDTCAISDYSDPILLGSQMDGLILVVQAGKTRLEVIQRSKNILNVAVPILGIVLNRRSHYIPDAIYRRL